MPDAALTLCVPRPGGPWTQTQIDSVRPCLERLDAEERVRWALDFLPGPHILTSSFGAQSAVMLHLVTRQAPDIPVVLIDTGYLFPETYHFVDELADRLDLNLKVFGPRRSPAWQEARWGRRWEQGKQGIEAYNQFAKVEPMSRALEELGAATWFSGLRRDQASTRRDTAVLQAHGQVNKVHPLADWGDRDIHNYLKTFDLPYHPLWSQGYLSIGDTHSSRPAGLDEEAEVTRFDGVVRECGLHEPARYPVAG